MGHFGVFLGKSVGYRKPDFLAVLAIGQFRPSKFSDDGNNRAAFLAFLAAVSHKILATNDDLQNMEKQSNCSKEGKI